MQSSSKKLSWPSSIFLSGMVALTTAFSASALPLREISTDKLEDNPKAIVDEAWQLVNREYVDGTFNKTDWLQVRRDLLSRTYSDRTEAYTAIRLALRKLDDPYTRFMSPVQYKSLTNQTSGEMVGIGLRIDEIRSPEGPKQLVVADTADNSPAARAGIKAGDTLLAINGQSTSLVSAAEAVKMIRGEVGKSVNLKLSRIGKGTFEVSLAFAQIEVTSVSYKVKQESKVKVGYIRLSEFSANSSKQMENAIKALNREQVNAFVLDMRGNPGGLLQNSIEIARMFLDSGVIVKTIDRQGSNEQFRANQTALTTLPLAVLVDGNSASASEILAGALKDHRRATIVGTSTFGKALVQSVHGLSDGSGLAVTVAHYYTPNGTDIGHKGVAPDLKVSVDLGNPQNLDEASDLVTSNRDLTYQTAISYIQNSQVAKPAVNGTISRQSPQEP